MHRLKLKKAYLRIKFSKYCSSRWTSFQVIKKIELTKTKSLQHYITSDRRIDVAFFLYAARKSLSPVLDSSSVVVKRRSPEEMDTELRAAEPAAELTLHPADVMSTADGEPSSFFSPHNHTFYL